MSIAKSCKIENCERKGKLVSSGSRVFTKGYCMMHYERQRSGRPVAKHTVHDRRYAIIDGDIAKIPLGVNAKDGYVLVDEKHRCLDKHQWHSSHGYASASINGRIILIHHLIVGKAKQGFVVDHINRDPLDNRESNLRHIPFNENLWNTGLAANNSSGYKNIIYVRGRNTWNVTISRNGQVLINKSFKTLGSAIEARDSVLTDYVNLANC